MKQIIILSLLIALAKTSFAQPAKSSVEYYLTRSKNQKAVGWILLGGGTALIGAGFLIGDRKESTFSEAGTGVVMGGVGLLSVFGSIPLLIASGKNKRRAKAATAFFKMETIPVVQQMSFIQIGRAHV